MNRTPTEIEQGLRAKFASLSPHLDERARRIWAATEAKALGRGGPTLLQRATGLSRSTIYAGLRELAGSSDPVPDHRVRRHGGGRKRLTNQQPQLLAALDALVEPTCRGDPQSPLRWACKSCRNLADALRQQGFRVLRHSR